MEPRVVAKDGFKLVGVNLHDGQHKAYLIPYLWAALGPRLQAVRQQVHPQTLYGVWYHPNQTVTEPASYLVGVEVSALEAVPPGLATLHVQPSTYAALTHRGDIGQIGNTYEVLHHWIRESGHRLAAPQAPTLEIYDTTAPVTDHYEVQVLEPIK